MRKGSRCAGAGASGPWERGHRRWCRNCRTSAGPRLRRRPVQRRPSPAHPGRGRRLQPRMLGARSGHLDLRCAGRPRPRPLLTDRGTPKMIVSDNGTELTLTSSCNGRRSQGGLTLHRAGKPCRMPLPSPSSAVAGRVAQLDLYRSLAHARTASSLARGLQHQPAALAARLDEPSDLSCGPRSAALRYTDGSAPRTAAITTQEDNVERQTPIAAG